MTVKEVCFLKDFCISSGEANLLYISPDETGGPQGTLDHMRKIKLNVIRAARGNLANLKSLL